MHIGSYPTAGVSLEEEYSISLNSIMHLRYPIPQSSHSHGRMAPLNGLGIGRKIPLPADRIAIVFPQSYI